MSTFDLQRPDIVAFVQEASEVLGRQLPAPKDAFEFGEGMAAAASDEILDLALQGKKTATTSYPVPNPQHWGVGDLSVVMNGSGKPAAIMRTLELHACLFKDVPERMALAEAEGDYEDYRVGHIKYYRARDGNDEFGDESRVLCELFEIVYSASESQTKT